MPYMMTFFEKQLFRMPLLFHCNNPVSFLEQLGTERGGFSFFSPGERGRSFSQPSALEKALRRGLLFDSLPVFFPHAFPFFPLSPVIWPDVIFFFLVEE